MTKRNRALENSHHLRHSVLSFIAACALALGTAAVSSADGLLPQEEPGAPPIAHTVTMSGADLEEIFWVCDYLATTRGMEATPASLCEAAYDELKTRKFGGEFGLLLTWWQAHKPAEHSRLAKRNW